METLIIVVLAVVLLSFHQQDGQRRRRRSKGWHRPRRRECTVCRQRFQTQGHLRNFCSEECRGKRQKAQKRSARSLRRARERRVPRENIDPMNVFKRDGWVCQLCGRATPKRQRGTTLPTAPEMDHIMPLVRDGSHTLNNVQLLCRDCNSRKSDRVTGPLVH